MGDERPGLDDLQAMSQEDLGRLVATLLQVPEEQVDAEDEERAYDFIAEREEGRTAVAVNRTSRGPALRGISLPAIAAGAKDAGMTSALVATTGVVDPERRGDLERGLQQLRSATGVNVAVLDGTDLLARVDADPSARARFFPRREEAEAVADAEDVPSGLVKTIVAVAPEVPATSHRRRSLGLVRLLSATAVIVVLVAIPLRVDAYTARWTASVGLGVLLVVAFLGWLSSREFGRPLERFQGPLIEQLLPLPDQTSVLRLIATAHPGTLALLAMIGLLALVRLLRLVIISGIIGFVAFFTFVYLLLWGIDPQACVTGAQECGGAFNNAGDNPSVGDFVYLATQSAFFQVPDDLSPNSRVARAVVTGEFVVAAGLLAGFAASLGLPEGL